MNARANLIVSRVCWIAMAIIATGLMFGPALCFAQVLGRPASESYVTSKINAHASTNNAHADIRAQVFAATTNVNALTIAATNATEAAHAATVQANAAILKNTQQDGDISYLYASNANAMAIANLANTRAHAANVTNAQNGAVITIVSNMTVSARNTADAAEYHAMQVAAVAAYAYSPTNPPPVVPATGIVGRASSSDSALRLSSVDSNWWVSVDSGTATLWRVSSTNRWIVTAAGTLVTNGTFDVVNPPNLFTNNGIWSVAVPTFPNSYITNHALAISLTMGPPWSNNYSTQLPPGGTWYRLYAGAGQGGTVTLHRVTSVTNNCGSYVTQTALAAGISNALASYNPAAATNALALASNAWQQATLARSELAAATNALVQTYLLNNSIVSTAVACTNVITVTSTQSVYVAAITSPCVISQDVSRLSLATNQTAQWTTKLNVTDWSATNGVTFATNINAVAGEFTVTGCYEFACSTLCNGMIQMRQTYPEIPQWRVPASSIWKSGYAPTWYASALYANSSISIITGSTNSCLIYASSPCIIELSGAGTPLIQPNRTNILHLGSADIAGNFSEEYAINLNWSQSLSPLRIMITNSTFGTFPEIRLETLYSTSQSTYVFPVRSRSATTHELRASALGWKP